MVKMRRLRRFWNLMPARYRVAMTRAFVAVAMLFILVMACVFTESFWVHLLGGIFITVIGWFLGAVLYFAFRPAVRAWRESGKCTATITYESLLSYMARIRKLTQPEDDG